MMGLGWRDKSRPTDDRERGPGMKKPVIMGGLMGLMMLWMLHGAVTGGGVTGWALVAFVGVHVALVLIAGLAAVFAARLSPKVQELLARVHRPSVRHIGAMLGTAVVVIATVHVSAHGIGGV